MSVADLLLQLGHLAAATATVVAVIALAGVLRGRRR